MIKTRIPKVDLHINKVRTTGFEIMNTVQIDPLADHTEVIPILAGWFKSEWAGYYAQRTPEEIAQDFYEEQNRDILPARLVGFRDGVLVGTIVLREKISETHMEYKPGLGGLYVLKQQRGIGIGTELVAAGMALAQGMGYKVIYTSTNAAKGIVERLHWEHIGFEFNHGEQVSLYRYTLTGPEAQSLQEPMGQDKNHEKEQI